MAARQSITSIPLDRLNGLLAWWGVPNAMAGNAIETRLKRFQAVASDLQKSYGDACDRQADVLLATNRRLAHSLQDACRSRHPRDIVTAETTILAVVLDAIQLQAQIWTGLTHEVLERCAALVSEPADERRAPAGEERETTPPPGRSLEKDASGQAAGNGLTRRAAPPSPARPEQSEHGVSRRSSTRRARGPGVPVAAASPTLDRAPGAAQGKGDAEAAAIMQGAEVASAASPGQEATIALGVRAEPGAADDLGPAGSANAGIQAHWKPPISRPSLSSSDLSRRSPPKIDDPAEPERWKTQNSANGMVGRPPQRRPLESCPPGCPATCFPLTSTVGSLQVIASPAWLCFGQGLHGARVFPMASPDRHLRRDAVVEPQRLRWPHGRSIPNSTGARRSIASVAERRAAPER